MLTLLASYAQEESRSASENQKWRVRKMFEQGKPNTGRMLGYRLAPDGLYIIPEEAELVKRIFNDYLTGKGKMKIANELNAEGIPSMNGNGWGPNGIMWILKNDKYTGDMILQKTYVADHISKRTRTNNGELPMYQVLNSHEAIIFKDMFNAVQHEMERRVKKYYPRSDTPVPYPFAGLLICGFCGKAYRRKIVGSGKRVKKPVWICTTFNARGKAACPSQQIPESILIEKTLEILGGDAINESILRKRIEQIQVPQHNKLIYIFVDGHTQEVVWQNPSRSESWTDEMKQAARERQHIDMNRRKKE